VGTTIILVVILVIFATCAIFHEKIYAFLGIPVVKIKDEIERKFLLDPECFSDEIRKLIFESPSQKIIQGYLTDAADGNIVRLRKANRSHTETIKKNTGDPSIRREREIGISETQFDTLWPATDNRKLAKTRYRVSYEGYNLEIDKYGWPLGEYALEWPADKDNSLEGLVIVEVEFTSKETCNNFKPPDWFGKEITGDSRYNSINLARHGLPTDVVVEAKK